MATWRNVITTDSSRSSTLDFLLFSELSFSLFFLRQASAQLFNYVRARVGILSSRAPPPPPPPPHDCFLPFNRDGPHMTDVKVSSPPPERSITREERIAEKKKGK